MEPVSAMSLIQGLTYAGSLVYVLLSQWLTSVMLLLFITLWRQEQNGESTIEDIDEFIPDFGLFLQQAKLDLNKKYNHFQNDFVKEEVLSLQKQLYETERILKKFKENSREEKKSKEFVTSVERMRENSNEKHSDFTIETSTTIVSHNDNKRTSMEQQTCTQITVNDLTQYKPALMHKHYVCINNGPGKFDNSDNGNTTDVAVKTESESFSGHKERKCLENDCKVIHEEQDSSENESISQIINREDMQTFCKKFNEFCKLIPEKEDSSSNNLSTASRTETYEESDTLSDTSSLCTETSVQVLYKPGVFLNAQSCEVPQTELFSECSTPLRRSSSEDLLSVFQIWNTAVQY